MTLFSKLLKSGLVTCHVCAFFGLPNNCLRTITVQKLPYIATRSYHTISEHRRFLALNPSDCGIGVGSCSRKQIPSHFRTLLHFNMSDTNASNGMEGNGENPRDEVQDPATAVESDVKETKDEPVEGSRDQQEESGGVAEAMERCKVKEEHNKETSTSLKETQESSTGVTEPVSCDTDPKKEGTEPVKEKSEAKETPSEAKVTEPEEGKTPENVPKKSKNQIKKEKRRALWNQNKEMYKEMKRLRKEEKERQIMEMEKRMEMQLSEESEEIQVGRDIHLRGNKGIRITVMKVT